jgi:hypothetical protein
MQSDQPRRSTAVVEMMALMGPNFLQARMRIAGPDETTSADVASCTADFVAARRRSQHYLIADETKRLANETSALSGLDPRPWPKRKRSARTAGEETANSIDLVRYER